MSESGVRIIDRVTGTEYEPTGEYRRPTADEDWLDPQAGHVYSGEAKLRAAILRRLPERQLADAVHLIRDFADGEVIACSLDHHGSCQEHGWFGESECPVPRAERWLASVDAATFTSRDG